MNWNYSNYLAQQLNRLNEDNLKIVVEEEEIYQKRNKIQADEVYVVIKYLTSTLTYESTTVPVQIIVLSEENELKMAQDLFTRLASELNWKIEKSGSTLIKQTYSTPAVLQNYAEIGAGYRSIMYVSCSLVLMENVVDFEEIEIDGIKIKPLGCSISYSMQGNTQQISGEYLATSVKSVSTLSLNITIPYQDKYYNGSYSLIKAINDIVCGNATGNKNFHIKIDEIGLDRNFKLTAGVITTAPKSVPSLQIGLIA